MNYSEDDFEVMAGRYFADNVNTTSRPYEWGFIKGFVAGCIQMQKLQQTDVSGQGEQLICPECSAEDPDYRRGEYHCRCCGHDWAN